MKLRELVGSLKSQSILSPEQLDREVSDIAHDSRKVRPGSLFVAVRGFNSDGHRFISQALQQGATAVMAEFEDRSATAAGVPQIIVEDSRRALALAADLFYGGPSRRLKLVGLTGTKGKTTTGYLVKSIIEAAGHASGLIGTIEYRVGERVYPAPNTTPESLDLQKLLREMVDTGITHCVMEVSSHALALGRTDHCQFETAVFTNLAQDHLDFHKDRQAYFQAKLQLFTGLGPGKTAVVNADDAVAAEIIRQSRAAVSTYGLSEGADIHPAERIVHGMSGLSFAVRTPKGTVAVDSPLVGKHNVYNILAAIGAGLALDLDLTAIARGISSMRAVPGRMEKVDEGQDFGVVVDYAHTEESLVLLLQAVREVAKNRVITVFGCGGDRDRTKRPTMGAAALAGSDVVIVTSDNPRTEDPAGIISEIESGMVAGLKVAFPGPLGPAAGRTPYLVIPARAQAIEQAICLAQPGDVVVLAGKGHEDYQIIGSTKIHFDDREVAREAIRKRSSECGVRSAE
ncbi:MAG: UDP-N-acetylmuramoyl-L-alanyl-D-glutamate--2,6-diaminopimelate ligase [Nitrospirae bacterium GWD2_57_9]|nr:MAG: UDP-N-acetylmuramoyl-L-alanyl-D-glutamate--2,6-diaminopimelate ligase [Nitrospirae bacterium GWD2_57_9]OGW48819.1 MAG: UDP-N-acetylmuramoyl-L-alanyl-D-glutamate--2,6-diaminopimelate ligase [Nitrospirae bacterium GWC2_57_9]